MRKWLIYILGGMTEDELCRKIDKEVATTIIAENIQGRLWALRHLRDYAIRLYGNTSDQWSDKMYKQICRMEDQATEQFKNVSTKAK